MLDETIIRLSELNNGLPHFREEIDWIPHHPRLQWPLQDLYEDHIDFCVAVARYLKKKPFALVNFLGAFWLSTPAQNLRLTKARMEKHHQSFNDEVASIDRGDASQLGYELARDLKISSSSEDRGTHSSESSRVRFPVRTGIPSKNHSFVGREDVLSGMHDIFRDPSPAPACCVVHGLGGVGKTETALEFTYIYRSDYDAVFWLPAERVPDLENEFAQIAITLGLSDDTRQDDQRNKNVVKARQWLEQTNRRWLLIFDNVEGIYELTAFLPTVANAKSSIILTTQMSDCNPLTDVFQRFPLQSFKEADASKLLFKCLDREPADEDEEEAARGVSDVVGGLPLAIAAIGGYIQQSDLTILEFLDSIKRSSNVWEASAVGPAKRYEKTLETVFDIALSPQKLGELPHMFINVLAFLNPDGIPLDIFTAHFKDPKYKFARTEDELTEHIRVLRRRQLVKREVSSKKVQYLTIHRSVQWNILLHLSKDKDDRWNAFNQALTLLRKGMPMTSPLDIPEPEKWPKFELYVPQVLNVRTHCLWPDPPVELPVDFAQILSDLATYMWHAGLASEGHKALDTAIHIMDDEKVDKDDPRRGDACAKLGILMSYNGVSDRRETLEHRKQAWEIRHKEFESKSANETTRNDEIRLYNVKCDLAWTYLHERDFAQALPIMEDCYTKYKSWDTEEKIPFEYAKYYALTSVIFMGQGKPDIAVKHAERGSALIEKAAGSQHPVTQQWRFVLGMMAFHAGAEEKSLEINQDILSTRKNVLGDFNHFTLESYSTCAGLLLRLRRPKDAKPLLKTCLERRKRSMWNPEGVARAQYRLSLTLHQLDEKEEAKKVGEKAFEVRDRSLREFPDKLRNDSDPEVVFDRMVSIWDGGLSKDMREPASA
ncbi:MAG: hypothetical protein Q9180_004523 [Flavoplaca navasiana]